MEKTHYPNANQVVGAILACGRQIGEKATNLIEEGITNNYRINFMNLINNWVIMWILNTTITH